MANAVSATGSDVVERLDQASNHPIEGLAPPTEPHEWVVKLAPAGSSDSDRLLGLLETEIAPFGILEASAAIANGPGGDEGGGRFLRLLRVSEAAPDGITALNLGAGHAGQPEEDLPRLDGRVAERNEPAAAMPAPAPAVITPPSEPPPPARLLNRPRRCRLPRQ